jgi:amino acid transporter
LWFFGIDIVERLSVILTILFMIPFVLMFFWGIPELDGSYLRQTADDIQWPVFLAIILWSIDGCDSMGNIAGNVKNLNRNYPIGMILSVFLMIITNVIPIISGVCLKTDWQDWESGDWPNVARQLNGRIGVILYFLDYHWRNDWQFCSIYRFFGHYFREFGCYGREIDSGQFLLV